MNHQIHATQTPELEHEVRVCGVSGYGATKLEAMRDLQDFFHKLFEEMGEAIVKAIREGQLHHVLLEHPRLSHVQFEWTNGKTRTYGYWFVAFRVDARYKPGHYFADHLVMG